MKTKNLSQEEIEAKKLKKKDNLAWYRKGLKDGIPIALGYFAVSFTLGIAAKKAGLEPWQAAIMSFFMLASAGEFAVITIIASSSGYLQMFLTTLVVNLRYLLMSCSLSQKMDPKEKLHHRLFTAYSVTDEIFGISSNVQGRLNPFYNYGAASISSPAWTIGTFLGAAVGAILPARLENAFSVALYGMFLAVVIPGARKNKVIAGIVLVSFAASFAFSRIPYLCDISEGMRIIILTVVIAAAAALIFPVKEDTNESK
ncbi:MAG: AzlC family ABC transporter permease [Treponemataceae bacterium]|nr:AzlC family ABC transporter permease [Treponemataceae bacterium]